MVYSLAILMYSKLLYIIYIHGIKGSINATHYRKLINYAVDNQNHICDLIYRNRSKSHIGSYEIIDFKDFNTL